MLFEYVVELKLEIEQLNSFHCHIIALSVQLGVGLNSKERQRQDIKFYL